MSAIVAQNIRLHPFGGSLSSATTTYMVGAASSEFIPSVPAGYAQLTIPGMSANALVIAWEIRNNGTDDIRLRFGPYNSSLTAAAGTTLDDYVTLKSGVSYNFPIFDANQQINQNVGGATYSVLLLESQSGSSDFTGMVTVWDPTDG